MHRVWNLLVCFAQTANGSVAHCACVYNCSNKPAVDDLAAVPAVRKVDYSGEFFAGRQGRSCDETCREKGKRCDMKGIKFANSCDVIKEHFPCKMCWKSQGSDQVRRNHSRHHPISGLVRS